MPRLEALSHGSRDKSGTKGIDERQMVLRAQRLREPGCGLGPGRRVRVEITEAMAAKTRPRRAGSASPHEGRFAADSTPDECRFPGSAAHERRRALDDDRAGVGAEHLEPQANLPDECVRLEALA
jgi:hypothetical protein